MDCAEAQPTKEAAAHERGARSSVGAGTSRVSAVDINPQFVVVRNFHELESTVRAIKAGPLQPRCTVYDSVGRPLAPFASLEEDRNQRSAGGSTRRDRGAVAKPTTNADSNMTTPNKNGITTSTTSATATYDDTSGTHRPDECRELHLDATNMSLSSTETLTSPDVKNSASPTLATSGHQPGTSLPFPQGHDRGSASPSAPRAKSSSCSQSSPGSLPHSPHPPTTRKMLCIWDIDDTLVASGAAGVRQNTVFTAPEMVSLFKALPNARHLLLSQGSIDDVFHSSKGRLRYLQDFFVPKGTHCSSHGAPGNDTASMASTTSSASSTTGGKGEKKRTSAASFVFSCGGTKERSPPTDEVTVFPRGTALIRLTTVRGAAEEEQETDFMYDATIKPKLHGNSTKDLIRWLVLRPTTWGITLATLNSLFAPSANAACVDGKVFHKMDVAWSLAKSGLWDSVFFIDNNLSEVGVVKHGMNINNVLKLQHTHHMYKFFQAEFLLLAASAKLRHLEKQLGRDVTMPPPGHENKVKTDKEGSGSPSAKANHSRRDSEDERVPGLLTRALTEDSSFNDSFAKETERGSTAPLASSCTAPTPLAAAEGASTTRKRRSHIPRCSPTDPTFGQSGCCRQVDLVVAHLHMKAETYRQILLGNRRGTGISTKSADVVRYTGQPTFIGDSSLTDEQYEAVLAFFRMEESMIYQLLDEEMRSNGFVNLGDRRKLVPHSRYVHMPVFRRPVAIPHMRLFYQQLCDNVETRVVQPLLKGGGLIRGASVIRGDAHIICTHLLRAGPFLDPFVQGALAMELFMVYTAEDNVGKASGEYVHRAVQKLLDDPNAKKGKGKKQIAK